MNLSHFKLAPEWKKCIWFFWVGRILLKPGFAEQAFWGDFPSSNSFCWYRVLPEVFFLFWAALFFESGVSERSRTYLQSPKSIRNTEKSCKTINVPIKEPIPKRLAIVVFRECGNLHKMLGKKQTNILPNASVMVAYHSRKYKIALKQIQDYGFFCC